MNAVQFELGGSPALPNVAAGERTAIPVFLDTSLFVGALLQLTHRNRARVLCTGPGTADSPQPGAADAAAAADASRQTQHNSSSSSSSGGGGLGWQALEGRVRQNLRSAAPSDLSTSSSSSEEDEARWG